MLELGKEETEKQKAQGKGINSRSHFVSVIKTLSECDPASGHFLTDASGHHLTVEIGQSAFEADDTWHTSHDRTLRSSVRSI